MKASNIILTAGLVLFSLIIVSALIPDDFLNHDLPILTQGAAPNVAITHTPNHLARNNTNPPVQAVLKGQVNKRSNPANSTMAVNGGINFGNLNQGNLNQGNLNQRNLGQAVIFNNKPTANTQQFSFATKQPVQSNTIAMTTPQVQNDTSITLQQGPPILSDAFPPLTHDNNGWNKTPCSLCHQVTRTSMAGKERMFANKNVLSDTAINYDGLIEHVNNINATNAWNRVHIWIRSQDGTILEIITAPKWFLEFVGCPVNKRTMVKGIAFKVKKSTSNTMPDVKADGLYAKNLIIDGQLCRLRSDKGLPLWSN